MRELRLEAIGVARTPFTRQAGTPVQPAFSGGVRGAVELDPRYAPALKDLDGFERVWLLCWLDRTGPYRPLVVPYLDDVERGLFATRAPSRPNPIGLSLVRLVAVAGSRLEVEGIDLLDGTPVLDVKPYVPELDAASPSRAGWLDAARARRPVADARFEPSSGEG